MGMGVRAWLKSNFLLFRKNLASPLRRALKIFLDRANKRGKPPAWLSVTRKHANECEKWM